LLGRTQAFFKVDLSLGVKSRDHATAAADVGRSLGYHHLVRSQVCLLLDQFQEKHAE
jgi:hypothetical protein